MKLLIVTQSVDRDDPNLGAFYCWFEELARRAERVVIIADAVGNHDLPDNVVVHSLGKNQGGRSLGRLWKFLELFSAEYAVCEVALFHQIPEFVLAASPFLLSLKKTTALWYAHKSVTWRLRVAERLVDWVFSSSSEGFRLPSKKVIFTGQAIDTKVFFPSSKLQSPSSPLRLITVGRIAPVKNYELILRACALLEEKMPGREWRLTIAGGPLLERDLTYGEYLKRLVGELGLEDRVEFLGPRPYSEIPAILREHDLFLNTSATGSLDKAVLEAMSCGLSVITANEAYRRIVPASSFLDRPSPEALAERVAMLASEPRPNADLRAIVAADHGLERMIEKMVSVLQNPIRPIGPIRPMESSHPLRNCPKSPVREESADFGARRGRTRKAYMGIYGDEDGRCRSPKSTLAVEQGLFGQFLKMLYIVNARMSNEKAHGIQLAKMCEALIEQGIDLELVVPERSASPQSLREFYGLRRDIPLRRLPILDVYAWGRIGFLAGSVSFIFSYIFFVLWKRMQGWRGVIYTTDIDQFSFVGIPLLGFPYVMELHAAKPPHRRWRWFLRGAACLVVINKIIQNKVSQNFDIPQERIAVHPNGIDLKVFSDRMSRDEARSRHADALAWLRRSASPRRAQRARLGIPVAAKVVLYVGRMYPWKGIEALVEAARLLEPAGIEIWIVGGAPDEIRSISGIADLPRSMHPVGSRPYQEIPLWLAAADLCVVLGTPKSEYSYYHTSPMKIFEYMAAGRPIVASATPANREILSEREAFFYEPDSAADLAEKIRFVFEHPEEAAAAGRAAAKKVAAWTWKKRATAIIAHISRWIL